MAITKIKVAKSDLKPKVIKPVKPKKGIFKVLSKFGSYLKGSWQELRQVRWPDRKSAWGLTFAVILFTGFFIALIVLLDFAFQLLFKLILK